MINWSIWFFFENHHAQYVPIGEIRNVNFDNIYPELPKSIADFWVYYFSGQRTSCVFLCPEIGKEISVWLNFNYETATVLQYSRGQELILIQFKNFKRIEWIYKGSERIKEVKQSMNKFFEQRRSTAGVYSGTANIQFEKMSLNQPSLYTSENMDVDLQDIRVPAKVVDTTR